MLRSNYVLYFLMAITVMRLLSVIATNESEDPCFPSNHVEREDIWRNVHHYSSLSDFRCDSQLDSRWYRFVRDNYDDSMPTYAVIRGFCGTRNTIWVNGSLPDVSNSTVRNLTVCVNTIYGDCDITWTIQAKHCGTYYVYYLVPTPGCEMAYCVGIEELPPTTTTSTITTTTTTTSSTTTLKTIEDPCLPSNHVEREDLWRNVHYSNLSWFQCDSQLDPRWYRFVRENNDDAMPTYAVKRGFCGTRNTLWVNGSFPDTSMSTVSNLTVCVNTIYSNCDITWTIQAKGCGTYYVYYLVPTPGCEMAYCVGIGELPTTTTTSIPSTSSSSTPSVDSTMTVRSTTDFDKSWPANDKPHAFKENECCSAWMIAVIIILIIVLAVICCIGVLVTVLAARLYNKKNVVCAPQSSCPTHPEETDKKYYYDPTYTSLVQYYNVTDGKLAITSEIDGQKY